MAFNRSLLHEERIKRGLTTYQLAEKVGVSQGTISKWEIGMTQPKGERMKKLCDYFNVEPDYWDHFYHEPQKPLESFRPSEKAKKAYEQAVNPHEADKEKVRENIEKINRPNSLKEALNNLGKAMVGDDIEHDAYKQGALQVISDLKNEIKAKDTEIQGLKCELEGLKVENARLQGQIEGMKFGRTIREPIKPVVTYASGTGDKDSITVIPEHIETVTEAKPGFWKRVFG